MRSMYKKTSDTSSYKGKKAKHTFRGKPCSLQAFSKETALPVYLIRHMLAQGFTMDNLADNRKEYEVDGTFKAFRKNHRLEHKKYYHPKGDNRDYFFKGQKKTISQFCTETKFPQTIIYLMLEDGLEMDEIHVCWDLWESIGVIDEWKGLSDKRFGKNVSLRVMNNNDSREKRSSEKERLKLIMSKPIDPKKSGAFYHMQNYEFKSQKDDVGPQEGIRHSFPKL